MSENTSKQKVSLAFRAPHPMKEAVTDYSDKHDMSQSDALRQLVREGLEAEELREELQEVECRVQRLEEETEADPGLLDRFFS